MNVDNPNAIYICRLAALKGAVKLEAKGLRRRGASAKSIAIKELGLGRNATHAQVIEALEKKIEESISFDDLG